MSCGREECRLENVRNEEFHTLQTPFVNAALFNVLYCLILTCHVCVAFPKDKTD